MPNKIVYIKIIIHFTISKQQPTNTVIIAAYPNISRNLFVFLLIKLKSGLFCSTT
jgi:hypothetical protein